jgi:hypothetical protein
MDARNTGRVFRPVSGLRVRSVVRGSVAVVAAELQEEGRVTHYNYKAPQ